MSDCGEVALGYGDKRYCHADERSCYTDQLCDDSLKDGALRDG